MGEWSYQHYDRPCDIVDIKTMQPVMSVNANEAGIAIEAHNADCAAYEARIAALEAMLADEVAENVRLRSREVGDEVGNLLQEVADLKNELARMKAEGLRVVAVHKECTLADMSYLPIDVHTNLCTACGVDWRIYAAERRTDDAGHRYLMPVSDQWPPIPMSPDTIVQPVRLERWEDEG